MNDMENKEFTFFMEMMQAQNVMGPEIGFNPLVSGFLIKLDLPSREIIKELSETHIKYNSFFLAQRKMEESNKLSDKLLYMSSMAKILENWGEYEDE